MENLEVQLMQFMIKIILYRADGVAKILTILKDVETIGRDLGVIENDRNRNFRNIH